jgi:hypothetical protein
VTFARAIAGMSCLMLGAMLPLGSLPAQDRRGPHISLRVVDSMGAPVEAVEVSQLTADKEIIALGRTDADGRLSAWFVGQADSVRVLTRKPGYERAERLVRLNGPATDAVTITLTRSAQQLEARRISARESLLRRAYYIDAGSIAQSDRPVFSALDVVERLRPDMVSGLGGCSGLKYVFVNGERIEVGPAAAIDAARARTPNIKSLVSGGSSGGTDGHANPAKVAALKNAINQLKHRVSIEPASVLLAVKPEHIADMLYNDCFARTGQVSHGENALFIRLKPGVGYSPAVGSYVADSGALKRP